MAKAYSERLARQRKERWEVEWCKSCPKDEAGDCDIDRAEMIAEYFHTREEAEARMREIESKELDFFGEPTMTHEQWDLDWIDEDTGLEIYHWTAGDCDVWRIHNGELWQ